MAPKNTLYAIITTFAAILTFAEYQYKLKTKEEDVCFPRHCEPLLPGVNSTVVTRCASRHGNSTSFMYGRCCLHSFDIGPGGESHQYAYYVKGLDLTHCRITDETSLISRNASIMYEESYLQNFMLEDNPLNCNASLLDWMGYLKYLSLPPRCDCPGSSNTSWSQTIVTPHHPTVCIDEIDLCSDPYNYTCPNDQSECVMHNPGRPWCTCKHGYHGYKCLKSGDFPMWVFVSGMVGGTLIISGSLWLAGRRKVKRP